MDTRRLITAVLLTFAIVFLYRAGLDFLGEKMGWVTHAPPPATQPAEAPAGVAKISTTAQAPSTTPGVASISAPGLRPAPATQPVTSVQIGSADPKDPNYRMEVTLVPQGAGIESVILNQFKRTAKSDEPYVFQQPYPDAQNLTRPLATRSAAVDAVAVDLHDAMWNLEPALSNHSTATFALTLVNDSGPVVRLIKTYEVLPASDASKGYELVTKFAWENLSGRAISIQSAFNGPTTPPREVDRGPDRYVITGYYDKQSPGDPIEVEHHAVEEFTKDKAVQDVAASTKYKLPLVWAGASSTYFNAIVRPLPLEGVLPEYIQKVQANALNPDAPADDREVAMIFQTRDFMIPTGQSISCTMRVFLGPKQRALFKDYYAQPTVAYNKTLVITGGLCGFCTFQWLIDVLVLMLRGFHFIFRDWGLAIIGLVCLVRLILHPITKKSQVSMMRMAKLGPEMERLRKKHGDDKEALSKAMWDFQKEQGVGAYLGCLPMFLQMPIWIALWSALNSTFELRQAPFLWGFTWIHDLSKPDHLIEFARPFVLFGFFRISGINILPILLAVVFYFQMKMQPKPATMTKEQEQQQKIMQWMMPVLFPLMLYNGPSGLNLYILASTFIGIVESKIIRDHIKQREEAEKEGRVIVDAGKKFGGGKKKRDEDDPPRRGIAAWLANLQSRAEQLRNESERRGKDKA